MLAVPRVTSTKVDGEEEEEEEERGSRVGKGKGEGGRGDLMMPHPGVARTLYRAKKDLITRSQLDPHSTCSNGRPRSINDPTQTLIIRSFASIAVRAARWQPWPGDVIVARIFSVSASWTLRPGGGDLSIRVEDERRSGAIGATEEFLRIVVGNEV